MIVATWLVCQTVAIVGVSLVASVSGSPRSHAEAHCTCLIAPGQACPMHHDSEKDRSCRLRSAHSGLDVVSVMVIGWGILPPSSAIVVHLDAEHLVATSLAAVVSRPHRPTSPPPRA